MIVLAPDSVQEMVDLTFKGFDLADKYRMTSMILSDGALGQMMEPVSLGTYTTPQLEKPWALCGTGCARSHNIVNSLYLQAEELEQLNFKRFERYAEIERNEAMYEEYLLDDADICVTAYGVAAPYL